MSHKRERLSRAGEQRPNERTKTTKAAKREGRTDTLIHLGRRRRRRFPLGKVFRFRVIV